MAYRRGGYQGNGLDEIGAHQLRCRESGIEGQQRDDEDGSRAHRGHSHDQAGNRAGDECGSASHRHAQSVGWLDDSASRSSSRPVAQGVVGLRHQG